MSETPQTQYESKLKLYTKLVNGTDTRAFIAKLQIYMGFLEHHEKRGENLWKIEPLLPYLLNSLEQDVHLTLAKFFDKSGYCISKFLEFCLVNHRNIIWKSGNIPIDLLNTQKNLLATHNETINAIKGRRDKLFAHRDKRYFHDPEHAYEDFPLTSDQVIALARCIISIIQEHEEGLQSGSFSFHVGEFFHISVDNMVRNLEAGRRHNFPKQEWD